MTWKARAIEAAYGVGATLFSVALYIVCRNYFDDADQKWIDFAAVIFGVFLTAATAIGVPIALKAIEDRGRRQELIDAIVEAEKALARIEGNDPFHFWPSVVALQSYTGIVVETQASIPKRTPEHIVAFDELSRYIGDAIESMLREYKIERDNADGVGPSNIDALDQSYYEIRRLLENARVAAATSR